MGGVNSISFLLVSLLFISLSLSGFVEDTTKNAEPSRITNQETTVDHFLGIPVQGDRDQPEYDWIVKGTHDHNFQNIRLII